MPPKKNALRAEVFFVHSDWCVGWDQGDFDAGVTQRTSPRVVVHARTAEHSRSAGSDYRDMHCSMSVAWLWRSSGRFFRVDWFVVCFLFLQFFQK